MLRAAPVTALVLLAISPTSVLRAQQKKVLTPEQQTYQKAYRAWAAKHSELQDEAKKVLADEMARERAGDCQNAISTLDSEKCFGQALNQANSSLSQYEAIIHKLFSPPPAMPGQAQTGMPGPAGPSVTPAQLASEFDHVEEQWRDYRKAACTAAYHQ